MVSTIGHIAEWKVVQTTGGDTRIELRVILDACDLDNVKRLVSDYRAGPCKVRINSLTQPAPEESPPVGKPTDYADFTAWFEAKRAAEGALVTKDIPTTKEREHW